MTEEQERKYKDLVYNSSTNQWEEIPSGGPERPAAPGEYTERPSGSPPYGNFEYRAHPGMGSFSGSRFYRPGAGVPPKFGENTVTTEEYQNLRDAVKSSVKTHSREIRAILYSTAKDAILRLGIGLRVKKVIKRAYFATYRAFKKYILRMG